jgi:hypothetical protein
LTILYIGETTPVFSIVQRRSRDASHRTTFGALAPFVTVGRDDDELLALRLGGKSLATQRSPCGEGVRR